VDLNQPASFQDPDGLRGPPRLRARATDKKRLFAI
jgi:hypothetical protein